MWWYGKSPGWQNVIWTSSHLAQLASGRISSGWLTANAGCDLDGLRCWTLRHPDDWSWSYISSGTPSQYQKRRLIVRSREVWKPRDWYFKLSYRFEIWQAHRQHCCRSACQISERSDNSKYKSRSFDTLRDVAKRSLFGYWDGARMTYGPCSMLSAWYTMLL